MPPHGEDMGQMSNVSFLFFAYFPPHMAPHSLLSYFMKIFFSELNFSMFVSFLWEFCSFRAFRQRVFQPHFWPICVLLVHSAKSCHVCKLQTNNSVCCLGQ
uniref:Uncharacterized protein n=1 Tax=Eutreptiella gymnastica TaxID=73025 RepID=A0A7S1IRM1_9EUGL|mmetsp:Transcript_37563/g.66941  ORF Transcript_37563/g.66941 Transcript_37563/m.66941 type:complete len:101 (+) Transcript_37563:867-1169(+)